MKTFPGVSAFALPKMDGLKDWYPIKDISSNGWSHWGAFRSDRTGGEEINPSQPGWLLFQNLMDYNWGKDDFKQIGMGETGQ